MKRLTLYVATWLLLAGTSLAQGVQTGTIRGDVTDRQGLPVPGVTVTVTSPALQGTRSAMSDAQGLYTIPALPIGTYQLKFELSGFAATTRATTVALGLTVEENVSLEAAGVTETVTVVAPVPTVIANAIVGGNFKQNEIEALASARTLVSIATLAPAVSEAAPNPNALVINGAFSFDNAFLTNGVDINDNVFGTPQNLFIEDAIEETQVLTSGIPAEFGRFSGGVVNAITKSGGNMFSGSGRINFSNPSWTTATPFEVEKGSDKTAHPDTMQRVYEATLGGPIIKDRLWFFASGRLQTIDVPTTLQRTGIVLSSIDQNRRGEIKFTGTVAPNHTIQGGYLNDPRKRTNNSGAQTFIIDPHSEVDRENPNWYVFTNYRGVFKNNLLAEAQYSERRFSFVNDGGTSATFGPNVTAADLALHSPFIQLNCTCIYNAPVFDSTDPEQRNNRQITGSVTKYWNLAGRHETKGGYEFFRSQHTGGNSQSPTQYIFGTDFVVDANGDPVLDSTGRPIPTFAPPSEGLSLLLFFPAVKGAVTNNDSHSVYVQDHWNINSRWSADLGARFEQVKIVSTGDIISVNSGRIVPRLAAAYDVKGNGSQVAHVTYGQYSGRYNEVALAKNSPVGNPPEIDMIYTGPAGQGYSFAPAFDLKNYTIVAVNDPTQNVKLDPNLKSPLTHEFTASYGVSLFKGRGYGEVSYVARTTHNIVEDFQTTDGGFTDVVVNGINAGSFTNIVYKNTDLAHRQYQGMVFQARYPITNRWTIAGNYTLQLKNDGDYEGEKSNSPGLISSIGTYPEAFNATRNFPDGRLQSFQRSRLRIWSVYDWNLNRFGALSISGLWRVDSAQVFSLVATNQQLTATQTDILAAAGYPDTPSNVGNQVFFDTRGSQFFKGYGLFDTSLSYNVPVFRTLRPWVKLDIFNLFNNQKLIAWDTTVTQNAASTTDALGLATGFTPGPNFGTATGNTVTNLNSSLLNTYPVAFNGAQAGGRTVRVAVGFRF